MKWIVILTTLGFLVGCGAKYKYTCTSDTGQTTTISINSLRDVEEGIYVRISDCGQNVTIGTGGLDNGHIEAQQIAAAIVPLAKAAAHAGGLP